MVFFQPHTVDTWGTDNQSSYYKASTPSHKLAHQGCSKLSPGEKSFCFLLLIKGMYALGPLLTSSYFPWLERMQLEQGEAEMDTAVPPVLSVPIFSDPSQHLWYYCPQ